MSQNEIYLHFFWHQHQPWYPGPGTGTCTMPWTRLHGIKDYYDMAYLCKQFDGWTQTINLVPSLIEQILGYVDGSITDRYFQLSQKPADQLTKDEQREIVERFFDAHAPRLIHIHPRYDELFHKRETSGAQRFTTQDFLDLQVWFNIAWIDPVWYSNPTLKELMDKQREYDEDDKNELLKLHIEILEKIIPIHKEMNKKGNLELTTTPYYHPILPLLCDSSIAKVSNPKDPVPEPPYMHPEDAEWHIREGKAYFQKIFDFQPNGVWPSEGSVSDEACALLAKAGFNYFATSQDILFRSTWADQNHKPIHPDLYRLHKLETPGGDLDCIFRDQHLSDLVGFHYANQNAKEAAQNFMRTVKERSNEWNYNFPPLVNVILDGENCWEFYPNDGHDFLKYLIEGIMNDSQLQPTTVPKYREMYPTESPTLTSIYPGSWIAHNFRIWIGHPEDNAAWHYLRQARDEVAHRESTLDQETKDEVWKEIHICEGSDWYWWFGDENSSVHDSMFDEQFRLHLSRIYTLLELDIPEDLKRPIKRITKDHYTGGIFLHPLTLNGKQAGYYDWAGVRAIEFSTSSGAMHQAENHHGALKFGRFQNQLYFQIRFDSLEQIPNNVSVELNITKPSMQSINVSTGQNHCQFDGSTITFIADLKSAKMQLHQEIWFYLSFQFDEEQHVSIPTTGELYSPAYTAANANPLWFA